MASKHHGLPEVCTRLNFESVGLVSCTTEETLLLDSEGVIMNKISAVTHVRVCVMSKINIETPVQSKINMAHKFSDTAWPKVPYIEPIGANQCRGRSLSE